MAIDKKGNELPKGIYQRGDKFVGRLQYEGKRYTVNNTTVKKVQKDLESLRYELEHGLYGKEDKIKMNDWFDVWINDYKKNEVKLVTIELYEKIYNKHIKDIFGSKYISKIKREEIQQLYNKIAKSGLARNTICNIAKVMNGMFTQAVKNEHILKNPCEHAIIPKSKGTKEKYVMTLDEQKKFMEYLEKTDCKYYDIFEFALYTGMRSGEILGLTWDNVDLENNLIHVKNTLVIKKRNDYYLSTPKTKSSVRAIPILKNVALILKKQKTKQNLYKLKTNTSHNELNLVFTNYLEEPISTIAVDMYLERKTKKMKDDGINVGHISMHCFRHTFATRSIEQGMNPQTLKSILGHTSLSMTMDLYAHVLDCTKLEEIKKLENII